MVLAFWRAPHAPSPAHDAAMLQASQSVPSASLGDAAATPPKTGAPVGGPEGRGPGPPLPGSQEQERQSLLQSLGVPEAPRAQQFESITRLVCTVFNITAAIVFVEGTDGDKWRSGAARLQENVHCALTGACADHLPPAPAPCTGAAAGTGRVSGLGAGCLGVVRLVPARHCPAAICSLVLLPNKCLPLPAGAWAVRYKQTRQWRWRPGHSLPTRPRSWCVGRWGARCSTGCDSPAGARPGQGTAAQCAGWGFLLPAH